MPTTAPAILRVADVLEILHISRTTLWEWRKRPDFPQAVRLGTNSVAWRAEDVQDWLDNRPPA